MTSKWLSDRKLLVYGGQCQGGAQGVYALEPFPVDSSASYSFWHICPPYGKKSVKYMPAERCSDVWVHLFTSVCVYRT